MGVFRDHGLDSSPDLLNSSALSSLPAPLVFWMENTISLMQNRECRLPRGLPQSQGTDQDRRPLLGGERRGRKPA
jgi:hypothetical protein